MQGGFFAKLNGARPFVIDGGFVAGDVLAAEGELVFAISQLFASGERSGFQFELPRFQVLANLPDEIMEGFRLMLYEEFGQDLLESITNESLTPRIPIPALMFHDVGDDVTPIEDSRAIARVWKHAQLIETEGLSHRGALQSKSIHEQMVGFLKTEL